MCCRMQTTSCPALPHSRRGVCSSDRVARTRFFRPNYGAVQVQPLSSPACPPRGSFPRRTTVGPVAAACLLLDPIQPRIARPCPCGWIILYSASLIGSGGQELATRPIVYALALSVCTVSRVPIDSTACAYEYGWATTDLSRQSALIYGPSQ